MQENLQHESTRGNPKAIKELDYYAMSKDNLIKKIHLLVHELKIYHRQEQSQKRSPEQYSAKDVIEKEIIIESYQKNEKMLKVNLNSINKELAQLKQKVEEKDLIIKKMKKQVEIYRKKVQDIDKAGGRSKINQLQEVKKQAKEEKESTKTQNMKLRKQVLQLNKKCKILQDLNRQTQLSLADEITTLKTSQINHKIVHLVQQVNNNKQNNPNTTNISNSKQYTIEMLSLKEQIRQLRQQLRLSQESKQQLKIKMKEREMFYSKMIASQY